MMRTQTQLHRVEGVRGTDYSPATPSHASPTPSPSLTARATRDWKEITGRQGKRKRMEGQVEDPGAMPTATRTDFHCHQD